MSIKLREKSLIQLEKQLKTLKATLLLIKSKDDQKSNVFETVGSESKAFESEASERGAFETFGSESEAFESLDSAHEALFAAELQEQYNKIIFKKHKV